MALQSQLFRGDPKLEAAAVSDAAHIAPGAAGPHVGKIQLALVQLDGADITQDSIYGPATAAAVLSYKRKRNIINPSYQAQADNIVGKMTMAKLDEEMLVREAQPDEGRCCHLGPSQIGGGPHESGFWPGVTLTRSSLVGTRALTPTDQAKTHKVDAASWAAAATQKLGYVAGVMAVGDPKALEDLKKSTAWRGLETHFHISTHSNPSTVISFLAKVYSFIEVAISRADDLWTDDLTNTSDFAYAYLGGFNMDKTQTTGKIYYCPRYLKLGPLMQTAVIVHESAHFVVRTVDHRASELPAMDGWPVDGAIHKGNTKKYVQLNADESMQNAYSFAQYALHMKLGFDKRLKYTKPPNESSD
jgi:peptidoglycan hydrolase-like protein with peptidoglycan-binding domain